MAVNCITNELVEAAKRTRHGVLREGDADMLIEFAATILPDEPLPDSYDRTLASDFLRIQHDQVARALREVDRFKESRREELARNQ